MSHITQLIHGRRSIGKLTAPAPTPEQINYAIRAAIAAPDHRQLTPWRFHTIAGDDLLGLSQLLVETARSQGVEDDARLLRIAKHPERAPLIIVVVTQVVPHVKVPAFEQLLSTGAAIQNMLLAFEDMGFGTMWRSGDAIISETFKAQFDAGDDDFIAGIVYVGTKGLEPKQKPERCIDDYCSQWSYKGSN